MAVCINRCCKQILKYLHLITERQLPSRSPGTHGSCAPAGQTPNWRETKTLENQFKSGAEGDGNGANYAR